MRGPQKSRRLRRYDRRDYQKQQQRAASSDFSRENSRQRAETAAPDSHRGGRDNATSRSLNEDWDHETRTHATSRRDKEDRTCATSLGGSYFSREEVEERQDEESTTIMTMASCGGLTQTTVSSLNERVRQRARVFGGRPRFPSRGRASSRIPKPSPSRGDDSTTQNSTTCGADSYSMDYVNTVQSAPSRYDRHYQKDDLTVASSVDQVNARTHTHHSISSKVILEDEEISQLAAPSLTEEAGYENENESDDNDDHHDDETVESSNAHVHHLQPGESCGSGMSPITHCFPASTRTTANLWTQSIDELEEEDGVVSGFCTSSSEEEDDDIHSETSHVLSQLLASSVSAEEEDELLASSNEEEEEEDELLASSEEDDDEDPCILSMEPESPAVDSNNVRKLKKSKSYIINEPRGSIVDQFVQDSSHQRTSSQLVRQSSSNSTTTSGSSSNSQVKRVDTKDRLACGFSVEPLSPMSELSDTNRMNGKSSGLLAMLEQYLPDDVSDGPMNRVFDHYIPNTFTNDATSSISSARVSASSATSHPLRFVNELDLTDSAEVPKKKKLHHGDSALTAKEARVVEEEVTEDVFEGVIDDVIEDDAEGIEVSKSGSIVIEEKSIENMEDYQSQHATLFPSQSLDQNIGTGSEDLEEDAPHDDLLSEAENYQDENDDDNAAPQNSLKNHTSIQVTSPKYRGWKTEELEVVLMDSPQEQQQPKDGENTILQAAPSAETDVCSSHSSYVRGLDTLQLELEMAGLGFATATPDSCDDMSSNFSIPPLPGALSYDTDDQIPVPPNAALDDSDDCDQATDVDSETWEATPLATRRLSINVNAPSTTNFKFPSSSHQQQANDTEKGELKIQSISTMKPYLRRRAECSEDLLVIRSTRSEEAPLSHQTTSYLDTLAEQIKSPPVAESDEKVQCDAGVENKENHSTPSNDTDFWQSSLDSLRQLKATHGSQRQLLTRLIAERNGANATVYNAKSKLTQCSDTYRETLCNKDHEIEGLRRANQVLRVQVAQVKAAKISKDGSGPHDQSMKETTRKLQDLNSNGSIVDKRDLDEDASPKSSSKLYRSTRTTASDLVEIDKCMFELKTKEITTLQVCDAKPPEEEERDDVPRNTDSEIQIAISKIVAKETAVLKQRVKSLEKQLEEETIKQHHEPDDEQQGARSDKEAAVAKWKSSSCQREALSKRLDKAQSEVKKVALENERLSQELKESRSTSQDYRDKLVTAVSEVSSMRKSSMKSAEHLERTLKYYKGKVLSMEEEVLKSDSKQHANRHDRSDTARREIASLRDLVETLQGDYAQAELRRVEEAAKHEAMELDMKRTKRDLESRTLDNADLLRKTEDLFAAKAECDEKMLMLESERVQVKSGSSKSQERDEFLQHYKRSVTKLEQEISSLQGKEKHAAESTRVEISSLRELIERLRHESDNVKRERDEATEKCRELEKRCEKAELQVQSREREKKEFASRADHLSAAKEAHEETIAILETEAVQLKLETHKQSLQSDGNVEVFKLNVLKLERELEALRENAAQTSEKAKKDVRDLEDRLSSLQDRQAIATVERDQSSSEFKTISSELENTKLDLDNAREDKQRLSCEAQQLTVTKEDYEGRLDSLRADLSAARDDKHLYIDETRASIEQYEREIESLKTKLQSREVHQSSSTEEAHRTIDSLEARILELQDNLEEEKKEKEQVKDLVTSYEEDILQLQKDLIRTEREQDQASSTFVSISAELERASCDLESRILDNTELSLRVEQLFAAKEECEEKLAVFETRGPLDETGEALLLSQMRVATFESEIEELREMATSREDVMMDASGEALLMSQMRVATLESEVEELHELAETQQEVVFANEPATDDKYTLNREKQEALAKCTYLSRENDMISAMLDSTRNDLSRTIIEMSRIEMDLDDARNGVERPISMPCQNCEKAKDAEKSIKFLSEQRFDLSQELDTAASENTELKERIKLMENLRSNTKKQANELENVTRGRQDLLEKIEVLEAQNLEISKEDVSSASEKKALLDEISRLETLQGNAGKKISQQQVALDSARDEMTHLKEILVRKEAQERNQSMYSTAASQLRSRVSDLEMQLRTTEESYQNTLEKQRYEEKQRMTLFAELRRAETKGTSAEREAAHFRIQLSEMEQKLSTAEDSFDEAMQMFKSEAQLRERLSEQLQLVEDKLQSKQHQIEDLSLELASFRSQEISHGKATVSRGQPKGSRGEPSKRANNSTKAGTTPTVHGSEATPKMNSSHKRDRNELLVLREQIANLQNDILAAEEERKASADEKKIILSKHAQASSQLQNKETEIIKLLEDREQASVFSTAQDLAVDGLPSRLTATLDVLDQKKHQIDRLEGQLTLALSHQEKYSETIEFLKQELISMHQANQRTEESNSKRETGGAEDDKDLRINHLEDCLERVANDKETYMEESKRLKEELATLKPKPSQESKPIASLPTLTKPGSEIARPPLPSTGVPRTVAPAEKSLFDGLDDSSSYLGIGASMSDMSVTSKTVMSLDSKAPVSGVVEKHSLYAKKLSQQLGLTREREEDVSRNVSRKVSLLLAEISKLNGSLSPNYAVPSHAERPALGGTAQHSVAGDQESLEFDLECRLADVTQLASMLDLLIVDKKKSEQKLKALFGANKVYMNETKASIEEKDEVLDRQGDVIDTLCEELAVLKGREKVESRTLVSEIGLLEENIAHLREQYSHANKQQEQAEAKYEMALRERRSLEVGLKQIRQEKEHCQKRMPRLNQTLVHFQREMELRIEKLKNSEHCPEHLDQHLLDSAQKVKKAVDDILAYADTQKRKELRLQNMNSSSSGTAGETQYFVTLNDYEYQLLMEKTSASRKENTKAIKATALSEKKFSC